MKWIKLAAVLILLFALAGCGTAAKESGWCSHDSMYKNWDHMKFSWSGYKSPTGQDVDNSKNQNWWGKEIPADNVQ